MKTSILASLAAILMLCGCATPQQSAGKVLASTAIGVDGCMKGWATWVVKKQATVDQELAVMDAYEKYQVSMEVATNAYVAWVDSGNSNAWIQAATVLSSNQTALLNLITKFQTKVTQ